jgi:hypothetical protein
MTARIGGVIADGKCQYCYSETPWFLPPFSWEQSFTNKNSRILTRWTGVGEYFNYDGKLLHLLRRLVVGTATNLFRYWRWRPTGLWRQLRPAATAEEEIRSQQRL